MRSTRFWPAVANETVSATDAAGAAFPVPSDIIETSPLGSSRVSLKTTGGEAIKLTGGAGLPMLVSSPASAIAKARNP